MSRRRKKGSILVMVVCLGAFLSVIIMSLMLVTTNGHALRKEENTRIENFYSADSGLEIASNEIVKVIKKAIDSGENIIKEKIENLESHPEIDITVEGWEQKAFKKEFEEYIDKELEKAIDNVCIGNTENDMNGKTTDLSKIYNNFRREGVEIKVDAIKCKR